MPYQPLITEYYQYKCKHGKKALDHIAFYKYRKNLIAAKATTEKDGASYYKHKGEELWYASGCPYYNIHENMVSKLCKSDLSKIPSTLFKMPHGLQTIHIRFKDPYKELKCILPPNYTDTVFLSSIVVSDYTVKSDNTRRAVFVLHFYSTLNSKPRDIVTFVVKLKEDKSLEDAIEYCISSVNPNSLVESIMDQDTIEKYLSILKSNFKPLAKNVLRLSCTIGFLADNTTICEPDILNSDKHLIENASPEEREALHQKAKNKRKYGYNIGTDRMFLGAQPFQSANKSQAVEGRELEYAHIRAGHPHAVRYGKGKELVKIMWFVPLTVRPDLPFKIENQIESFL